MNEEMFESEEEQLAGLFNTFGLGINLKVWCLSHSQLKWSFFNSVFFNLDILIYFLEILQWTLHDWSHDNRVKILKQCRKVIPENGKVIIVDAVLNAQEKTMMDPTFGLAFDLLMLALSSGGKERSEEQWKNFLVEAGFPRFNVIVLAALQCVIEAFHY